MSNSFFPGAIDWVTFSFLIALLVWGGIWKGFALYRAGRVKDPVWFVVLFIVNTAGILEILYLFVFSKRASKRELIS